MVWCLLIVVPWGAASSAVVGMLGSRHFHREPASLVAAADMRGWQDIRRSARAFGDVPRPHSHAFFERHRHVPGDAGVVSVDADEGDASAGDARAGSGAAGPLLFATGFGLTLPLLDAARRHWPDTAGAAFQSRDAEPLERPPRG